MAILDTHNPWAFTFGLLGNIISCIVFLAPFPTFRRIYRNKSTEGFHSVPYIVALFSAMLWIYYASQKHDTFLLITINGFGCVVETLYIAVFLSFATRQARKHTLGLLLVLNFGVFSLILLLSQIFSHGAKRIEVLGWICVAFAVSVFAAPLSIMRQVIRTRSVEFLPFHLSLFLTISAVVWLGYGIALHDRYVALPNILGLVFGAAQMTLYVIYKFFKHGTPENQKLPEKDVDIGQLSEIVITKVVEKGDKAKSKEGDENKDPNVHNIITEPMNFEKKSSKVMDEGRMIVCTA